MSEWHEEHEPFPAFLQTLSALDLVKMRHEARALGDKATADAVMTELKRRAATITDETESSPR